MNLERSAKRMPNTTLQERFLVLEKVNTAVAHINLAIMLERGAFDV